LEKVAKQADCSPCFDINSQLASNLACKGKFLSIPEGSERLLSLLPTKVKKTLCHRLQTSGGDFLLIEDPQLFDNSRGRKMNLARKGTPKPSPKEGQSKPGNGKGRAGRLVAICTCALATGIIATMWIEAHAQNNLNEYVARPAGTLTFNKDIAPIIFQNCSACHRPGQSAPFNLLGYEEVTKHRKEIAEVTARRYMPPWLPEPGHGDFAAARLLSTGQLGMIQQWVAEGGVEGNPADLPPLPKWRDDWQLGEPDLVVTMAASYTLPAEGKDVYRNFVIPVPLTARRYVKAVEFRPGNAKIVHHAFLKVDRTRQSRRLDGRDGAPGFPGMNVPDGVEMPEGHFLSWQPGKSPSSEPEGLSWTLETNSDLVLQLHLRPSGKPEGIQSKVALYFTETRPTNTCSRIALTSLTIDIPPGLADYRVQDDFVLPVDVQALAVLPHAHYLGKEMQGYATLPDGTTKWLILIKNWDFNWQGDYRYASPVSLPKGTKLSMRFTYDNSTDNIRNPNHPPKRVTYGPQTTDEMAELWFQLLPRNRADREVLAQALSTKMQKVFLDYDEVLLRADPTNVKAHIQLAVALLGQGKAEEAQQHLRAAAALEPQNDQPHYYLGLAFRQQHKLAEARAEFESALRLNPDNFKAHGNLGLIFAEQGILDQAESHLRGALRINPDDTLAQDSLNELLKAKRRNK